MKILCTFEEYDQIEELFNGMYYKAEDYVPTDKEIDEVILPDLKTYVLFLLWIDLTGEETDENRKARKRIRTILNQNIELVDEVEETKEKGENIL